MFKMKNITVKDLREDVYPEDDQVFEVIELMNSIEFRVGEKLTRDRINILNTKPEWKVKVK